MFGNAMVFEMGRLLRLGVVVLVLLAGCDSSKPIKIGFVAGTSGRVADLGISGRDAVQLLVDQANEEGGIRGSHIR